MITYMQFIDENISLSVSEATVDDNVCIVMEDVDCVGTPSYQINLDIEALIRLKKWISEAISVLEMDSDKSKAP